MEVSSAEPGALGAVGDERRGRRQRSTQRRPREAAGRTRNRPAAAGGGGPALQAVPNTQCSPGRDFRVVVRSLSNPRPWSPCPWTPCPRSLRVKARPARAGRQAVLPADLHRERPVACRHEPGRNETARRKRDQHDAGHESSSVSLAGTQAYLPGRRSWRRNFISKSKTA